MAHECLTIRRGTAVIFVAHSANAGLLWSAGSTPVLLCFQQEFGNKVRRLTTCSQHQTSSTFSPTGECPCTGVSGSVLSPFCIFSATTISVQEKWDTKFLLLDHEKPRKFIQEPDSEAAMPVFSSVLLNFCILTYFLKLTFTTYNPHTEESWLQAKYLDIT